MEGPHKGRHGHALLPRLGPPAAVGLGGHDGQDLGRLPLARAAADVRGPHKGRVGRDVQQHRHAVPLGQLRQADQALGHGDRPVHQQVLDGQDATRRPLQPHGGACSRVCRWHVGQEDRAVGHACRKRDCPGIRYVKAIPSPEPSPAYTSQTTISRPSTPSPSSTRAGAS